ncbi:DUF4349 domain-containing protein [Rhizomonospora bruguierae]|uniref:DUF4349 domain-containing protein n=1 Tax=Rhizomonospora bruguierae TaxID=1581705 RepID=UPI001BD0263C|nr:DUF4349 domain-containing protein [Micromonospora sp. NBRC 107566]
MNRRFAAGLAILLVAPLALAGCSGGASDSASSQNGASTVGRADAADAAGAANAGKVPAAAAPEQALKDMRADVPARYEADPRAIVYTGTITVRVPNPDEAANRAGGIATGAGGFVGGDQRTSDSDRSEATLTLRVPAATFASVVDDLARLGKEESREIRTEDVTEQVVDLDARLASQRASVTRTRALLAEAKTIGEIVSVEAELSKRESELGALEARKRTLDNLTTLSTITATLLAPRAKAPEKERTGFVAGVKSGWNGFVASLRVLLTVVGVLLPWLLVLGVPVAAAVWLTRRYRRRPAPPAPAPAPEQTA